MKILVTIHFESGIKISKKYDEDDFLLATTEYLRLMQNLKPGQKVSMTSESPKTNY
jgi:hypothetical protein